MSERESKEELVSIVLLRVATKLANAGKAGDSDATWRGDSWFRMSLESLETKALEIEDMLEERCPRKRT